ncbi:uncharacterized protein B0H64DRAFT_99999 [Chaetomium fimeti]|uniref:Uncharacterized protein n=1 Tax=Chaetomium fimeti TaxID=1854472 RepID=A0AAE0HMS2_9PEZI|nr:hypothetical protein B0H64DRAFT_99999 [Chaetomium fimeti]
MTLQTQDCVNHGFGMGIQMQLPFLGLPPSRIRFNSAIDEVTALACLARVINTQPIRPGFTNKICSFVCTYMRAIKRLARLFTPSSIDEVSTRLLGGLVVVRCCYCDRDFLESGSSPERTHHDVWRNGLPVRHEQIREATPFAAEEGSGLVLPCKSYQSRLPEFLRRLAVDETPGTQLHVLGSPIRVLHRHRGFRAALTGTQTSPVGRDLGALVMDGGP